RQNWTVAGWRDTRFATTFADFDVEVLDASGVPVHGKTLLSTVRATYEGPTEGSDQRPDGTAAPRRSDSATSSARTRGPVKENADRPLGIETTLWAAADKL